MCKIIEIIYGYKVLISSILCHIFWQKEWLVHLCTYDNVRIAVYIVYDFYEKMCNCVRTKLQFRHSNDNNSTRTWTRVWLSLQWSYIHLPTKMLFIISFCKSLLVNSNIYTYKVHRYLNIYIPSLSNLSIWRKKRRRLNVAMHTCISMYNLSDISLHIRQFRESLEMALIIIF